MRHKERTQMGVALCAVLLCLTSTAAGFSNEHKPVSLQKSAGSQSSSEAVNVSQDISVAFYRGLGSELPAAVVTRADSNLFQALTQSVNEARPEHSGRSRLKYVLVFYKRPGVVDRSLYVTNNGLLYEPKQNCFLRPNPALMGFIKQHLENH